jgi:hypothetical protein
MATINLGAIKFNWKGAYNSGTTYAVDDVVSSGGNSYVCIQAHSTTQAVGNATAYWNIMSSAGTNGTNGNNGTNGTDVGTIISATGDMLYRSSGGASRLPKGTAGQVLQMNSAANAPEWATAGGGKIKQIVFVNDSTQANTQSTSFQALPLQANITPTSSSSKILILYSGIFQVQGGSQRITIYKDGSNLISGNGCVSSSEIHGKHYPVGGHLVNSPSTTSQVNYRLYHRSTNGDYAYIDPTANGSGTMTLIEFE